MKSRYQYCTYTAVAALLIGLTGAAQAQNESMETVTVTGFRASLATALNAKQNSNLVMESVVAEDIGKMPDQDVAESLQRLPGVQITRDQGKGATVLINGLRQNLTTLNGDVFLTGKEFYTYGEASGGGNGGNIQYNSLSTIPSDEIAGIDVYKTPNASLTEGGMGGTLNVKTRDPLAGPQGFSFIAAARGTSTSYNSLSKLTPGGTLVASYKPSNKIAFTASVSYDDVTTKTREMEAYNRNIWTLSNAGVKGYNGVGPLNATNGETNIGQTYLQSEMIYFSDVLDQSKTTGATAGVTWAPTSAITSSFTWFYSHNWDRTTNYSDKVAINGSESKTNKPGDAFPGIDADLPYTIDKNGIVESATYYVQGAETATLVTVFNSDASNYQWHTNYDAGGPLTATLDVAFSRATSNLAAAQQDIEHGYYGVTGGTGSAAPTAPGCNNMSTSCTTGNPAIQLQYNNGGSSGLPTATYVGAYADVLSNPDYALFKSAWAWNNNSKMEQGAIRGSATYKPSFLSAVDGSFSAGFRIASRNVWQNFGRYLIQRGSTPGVVGSDCCYDTRNGTWLYYQDPGYDSQIPYDTARSNPALALSVNNFMMGNMLVKNPVAGGMQNPSTFLNTIWNQAKNVPAGALVPNNTEKFFNDTKSSFRVHESTQALYGMADFGNKDKGFHINAGVRLVFTKLLISGANSPLDPTSYGTATWNGVNNNNIPYTSGHSTVDVLPSLNIAFYPTDDQIIRLSAARVMSPSDLFNLGLGQAFNFSRETGGRVNVHTGVKDGFAFNGGSAGNPLLDPYRATQFNVSWEDYFAPQSMVSVSGFYKQVENFQFVQPVQMTVNDDFGGTQNTVNIAQNSRGSIYGLELAAQYVTDLGLGIAANYTYTQSQSAIATAFTQHLPIPNVAPHAATATVFYENYGIDARMSYSWRSTSVNGTVYGSTLTVTNTLGNGTGTFGNTPPYGVYLASYGQLDAQVSYSITDNLSAYVSGQNLTEEASHAYLQFKNQPFFYDNTGARYFFGVRFKY